MKISAGISNEALCAQPKILLDFWGILLEYGPISYGVRLAVKVLYEFIK